jgi:hypothetical protein
VVVPEFETANEVSGVMPPTAPVKVAVPPVPAFRARVFPPFNVDEKVMLFPAGVKPLLVVLIMLGPVRVTACPKSNGLAPETVMLLPTWMPFELVKVMLVGAAVPPTAAPKLITPPVPARRANVVAPFTVDVNPEKLMLAPAAVTPPFVVSMLGAELIVVGPVKVTAPPEVVILLPKLIAVGAVKVTVPVEVVVMLPPTLMVEVAV